MAFIGPSRVMKGIAGPDAPRGPTSGDFRCYLIIRQLRHGPPREANARPNRRRRPPRRFCEMVTKPEVANGG